MNNNDRFYKDLEFTSDNDNIQYYVIINYTHNNNHVIKKSIIFQMEPWIYDEDKKWGIKTWGNWTDPKEDYLYVNKHINKLNPAQWMFDIPKTIHMNRYNKIISFISYKNIDTGHINRINFIKYIESKGYDIIDIYSYENYHNFRNYKGSIIDKSIQNNYKYILSVENNREYNYATEKLWESFISYTLCFYDGCPNISDYVDPLSYIPIDLSDYDKALSILLDTINSNLWIYRLPYLIKAKELTINKYNIFELIYNIIYIN
jgi:hypothetical protein